MKKYLVCLSVVLSIVTSARSSLASDFKPAIVVQTPENVFAPMGFDNNDNAQIVLYGNLPDTCHKAGTVRYRIDKSRKTIFIRNEVYFYSGCWCADVLVPYIQTVNLGVLREGNYEIVVEAPDGSFKKMARFPVSVSTTAGPDEYLYAPVENVHFKKGNGSEPSEVLITGAFRNSCMYLEDVKVTYRPNHVIEIQPVAGMQKGNDCVPDFRLFSAKVELKDSVHGRALIHVRSLNGQALNQVIEL